MQVSLSPLHPPTANKDAQLMTLANKIETQFLSEMLQSAGVTKTPKTFGGGAGEDQFTSFLAREYAAKIVDAGGLGLSESIYKALVEKGAQR